ncbi:hypothetical protein CAOG_02203 [Capsaspora owczarzaki ATCC 30864]|uniref:hypothetical protein n=1 Tax=Capsaspora owczarzaki (strain ATCC 30864) TaxID=595528 RepID=UPI0003525254|nr:hypothetical protein CAOG_02203 [Capsaspora owczarzaki ATCC 30864]|eukprot:XP_004348953.2 hypothetical protein CAOG_02203 [Capsaspora owczarzaki ATCC 30864]
MESGRLTLDHLITDDGGRTIFDHGGEIDLIEGVIKVSERQFLENKVLIAQVACDYVYEDSNWDIHEDTFYQRQVELHPNSTEAYETTAAQRALVRKVGGACFPFIVRLPHDLPASVILKPESYFEGKPIGISWTVRTWLAGISSGTRTSIVTLPFQKINFFPLLTDVKPPSASGQKSFMFDNARPLTLKATLEKEVFYHNEPINVKVQIENLSKKEVCAIKISVKQIVEVRFETSLREKIKSVVATIESTRGCPIKKHSEFSSTYSVTPKVTTQETHHVAQEYKLNMADNAQLAATTRLTHTTADLGPGVTVSYYINVHAVVAMGSDLIVKLPFTISYPEPEKATKAIASSEHAHSATSNAPALAASPAPVPRVAGPTAAAAAAPVHAPEPDLLINFDDDMPTNTLAPEANNPFDTAAPAVENPFANPFAAAPPPQAQQGIQASLQVVRNSLFTAQTAYGMVSTGNLGVGDDVPLDTRVPQLAQTVRSVGATISQLNNNLSLLRRAGDQTASLSIIQDAANVAAALRSLEKTSIGLTRSLTDPSSQHALLGGITDILDKSAQLIETVGAVLADPGVGENRGRFASLAEYISQALPAIIKALPGNRECQLAIDTIATISSHLDDPFSELAPANPAAAAAAVVTAADLLHQRANALSDAFKGLGSAVATPGHVALVVQAATNYRAALPPVLAAGRQMAQAFTDARLRSQLSTALKAICHTSVRLLTVVPQSMIDGSPAAKKTLEDTGALVVESMRALLNGTAAIKAQFESIAAAAAAASGTQQQQVPVAASAVASVTTTPTTQPASAGAAPVNPAQRFLKTALTRRDSFEDFIQQGRAPVADVAPANDVSSQYLEADSQLRLIAESIAGANRSLADSRSRPHRNTVVASDSQLQGAVIDAIFPIVISVSSLVESARSRVNELAILGRHFHSANFSNRDRSFTDVLVSTARELSTSITALVSAADLVMNGSGSIDTLIRAASGVSSDSARLVAASQVQEHVNSNSQQEVEESSRGVTRATTSLITAAEKIRASSGTAATSGAVESPELRERQVRDLEKDLQSSQRSAFLGRKGSLWRVA